MIATFTLSNLVLVPALAWVVVSDLLYRRIANRLLLALLALWLASTAMQLAQGSIALQDLLIGVGAAAAVMVIGYLLFTVRWMGAGDAKLMAVLCLWMAEQSLLFLMVTALAGGLLAMALPMLSLLERYLALALMHVNTWLPRPAIPMPQTLRKQPVSGIPYGLAIAMGALFVLWGNF